MEICVRELVNHNAEVLFETFLDITNLPTFFHFMTDIIALDDQPKNFIGKRYLERTKSFFSQNPDLELRLIEYVHNQRICFQSNGRLFNHKIWVEIDPINQGSVYLSLAYVICKNDFIFYLPGVKYFFERRLIMGIKVLNQSML